MTPDFRTPMRNSMLWVYEGQTQFWGYVLQARRVMSIGGLVTLLVLAGGLAVFWAAEIKKKKSLQTASAATAVAVN